MVHVPVVGARPSAHPLEPRLETVSRSRIGRSYVGASGTLSTSVHVQLLCKRPIQHIGPLDIAAHFTQNRKLPLCAFYTLKERPKTFRIALKSPDHTSDLMYSLYIIAVKFGKWHITGS